LQLIWPSTQTQIPSHCDIWDATSRCGTSASHVKRNSERYKCHANDTSCVYPTNVIRISKCCVKNQFPKEKQTAAVLLEEETSKMTNFDNDLSIEQVEDDTIIMECINDEKIIATSSQTFFEILPENSNQFISRKTIANCFHIVIMNHLKKKGEKLQKKGAKLPKTKVSY
jgi:hypothetical protein